MKCGSCRCLLVLKVNGIRLTVTATPSHSDPTTSDAGRLVDFPQNQRQLQHVPTDSGPGDFKRGHAKMISPLNEIFGYVGSDPAVNRNDITCQTDHLESSHEGSVEDLALVVKADHPTEFLGRSPKNRFRPESADHNFGRVTSPQVKKYFSDNRHSNGSFPHDPPKINKGGRLSFTGLIKKSFKNISRTTESLNYGKHRVVINGHPIPNHLIRKVEQIAGPILLGSYWYDYEAGFWGVQGQPCLGIIPSNIEEFNYPMQKNCSGGNTSILINGRELHQMEFNLLVERGLPTSRNKSYIVEISGRIFDAETGEEQESLGKLAPTVEQLRRGFGMCPLSLI